MPSDLHRPMGSSDDGTLTAPRYDGIDSSMPQKMTLAFDTAEPVSSKNINMTSTMVVGVGLTEWCTQTVSTAMIKDREGMQPSPRHISGCCE